MTPFKATIKLVFYCDTDNHHDAAAFVRKWMNSVEEEEHDRFIDWGFLRPSEGKPIQFCEKVDEEQAKLLKQYAEDAKSPWRDVAVEAEEKQGELFQEI